MHITEREGGFGGQYFLNSAFNNPPSAGFTCQHRQSRNDSKCSFSISCRFPLEYNICCKVNRPSFWVCVDPSIVSCLFSGTLMLQEFLYLSISALSIAFFFRILFWLVETILGPSNLSRHAIPKDGSCSSEQLLSLAHSLPEFKA